MRMRKCTGDSHADDLSISACARGLGGYLSQSVFRTELVPIQNLHLTIKYCGALRGLLNIELQDIMDAFLQQMFAQQGREILQAEANNERTRQEAAVEERSRQEAEALRRQHEEQRRRQAAEAQRLQQQQHAANMATLQGQRTSNWYTMNPTR